MAFQNGKFLSFDWKIRLIERVWGEGRIDSRGGDFYAQGFDWKNHLKDESRMLCWGEFERSYFSVPQLHEKLGDKRKGKTGGVYFRIP